MTHTNQLLGLCVIGVPETCKEKFNYTSDLRRTHPWRIYVVCSWSCLTCVVSLQFCKHQHFSMMPKMLFRNIKVLRGSLCHILFGLLLREHLDRVLFVFQIPLLSQLLSQAWPSSQNCTHIQDTALDPQTGNSCSHIRLAQRGKRQNKDF